MTLEEKVDKAKLLLIKKKHFTFISSMLYRLSYKESNEVSSMAYDGLNNVIYLNPKWFLTLSDEEACSALAHESLHYALQHDIRIGRRDPILYQKAADHVVNNLLMDYNFELPPDVLVDRRFQNKTTEYVYKLLWEEKENQDQDGNGNSQDSPPDPFSNDIQFNPSPSTSQQSQRNQQTLASGQADERSLGDKSIGSTSLAFSEFFKDIKKGKQSWRDILMEYVNEISQGERDWARLDRRMLQLGYYLPDNKSDNRINRIAVAIDISGSVSQDQISYFLRETKAIKNNCDPEILDIVSFNTRITGKWSFKQDEELNDIKMDIDGGTSLEPVWKHYKKEENKPEFLIVFSDMYVNMLEEPEFNVIWCVVDNPKWIPPYGKAIYINEEDYSNE